MRVLHVIPSIAPRDGGPSGAVMPMCRALRNRGIDVTLATTDADGAGSLPVRPGAVEQYDGLPVIFFRREWTESFKYSRSLARWLDRHVADFTCVHVHAVFSHSSVAAARACRGARVPYIVRPLGSLEAWSLRQKPIRKKVALALGCRRMLRRAAAIHYTTERERLQSETSLGLSNGVVIPLGVDLSAAGSPNPSSPDRAIAQSSNRAKSSILFLSRLHPKKNIELLIDAFDEIAAEPRFREWRVVIAGDGNAEYVASLRKRAAAKASAERIRFCGWLDGEGKSLAFAEAGLFVLPSVQENFGLAALEAMAHGVAVAVSADVDLSDEVAASGAGWVFPRTARDLSRTLEEAMGNPSEAKKRGEKGREAVERRFHWTGIAGELERLYRRVDENGRMKVRRRAMGRSV